MRVVDQLKFASSGLRDGTWLHCYYYHYYYYILIFVVAVVLWELLAV